VIGKVLPGGHVAAKLLVILNDHNLQGVGTGRAIRTLIATCTRLIRADLAQDPMVCGNAILVMDYFDTGNDLTLGFIRERPLLSGDFTGRSRIAIAAEDGSCVT